MRLLLLPSMKLSCSCLLLQVRVVILGQDPYHGARQAMGLCFSVPPGISVPSSLQNMFKELQTDVGCRRPGHGDLTAWTLQVCMPNVWRRY